MSRSARDLRIEDFDYPLPDDRIARFPTTERDGARQLIYRNGEISEAPFRSLADRLPAGTLLIGNRTLVIRARLHFPLEDGQRPIEIFCLDPLEPHDYAVSLGSSGPVRWKCLVGGNRRWKSGPLFLTVGSTELRITRGERLENAWEIDFSWSSEESFGEVLERAGSVPLPPYLGREPEDTDTRRYQTVFARTAGSVAAPTAGLHFTTDILRELGQKGTEWAEVVLHVGAGTFKPVKSDTLDGHAMHREFFAVTDELLHRIALHLRNAAPIVSVGTTSLRCLESLHYLGAAIHHGARPTEIRIGQWVAEDPELLEVPPLTAIEALRSYLAETGRTELSGYTSLLLSPAATLRIADGLITNFHQPRSTLLLLVAALVGEDWKKIYEYALDHGFRFLSYGDSSLLWRRGGAQ